MPDLESKVQRHRTLLRTLLMHAARGTLSHSLHPTKPSPFRTWARTVAARRGSNIATAAIANRLARMVWRVFRKNPLS